MASNYGGYMGRILLVDLTKETSMEYPWTDAQRKETLGGKILAYRILSEHLTEEEEPFSEENRIIFSTGPLTGTGVPASVRFEITALSPKTRKIVSSNCGGRFGLFLKKAGFDAVILKGKCASPRWIEIRDENVHFHDACALWGTKTSDCQARLKQISAAPCSSLCIGPAGEDLLTSASIICGRKAVGRAGLGAVLGWKNVKAITVSGNAAIPLYQPEDTSAEIRRWVQILTEHPLCSDPKKISSCPGCPIRCKKPDKNTDSILNDLGIDSMDAENYRTWLLEKLGAVPDCASASKSGQRRSKLYHSILQSLEMEDCEEAFRTYQALTDVISASGLCIFAVIACFSTEHPGTRFPISGRLPQLLQSSTGMCFSVEDLLAIASRKAGTDLRNAICDL